MYVSASGNVGIGTSTPAYKLDVNGIGNFTNNILTPNITGSIASGGTLTLSSTSNATKGKILFGNSAYDEVNNRLGIGTTSPTQALDLNNGTITLGTGGKLIRTGYSSSTGNAIQIGGTIGYKNTNAGITLTPVISIAPNGETLGAKSLIYDFNNSNGLVFGVGNGTNIVARASIDVSGSNNTTGSEAGDLQFFTQTGGTAMSEKMRIFGGGNIAIGTSTDNGYKLYVNGTGNFSSNLTVSGYVNATTYGQFGTVVIVGGNNGNSYKTTNAGSFITGTLGFFSPSVTSGAKGIYIDPATNGLVFNIGNSSNIHISRASIQASGSNNTGGSEAGDLIFLTQTGGTAMSEKMRIFGGGNVAIGKTTANATLDITGSAIITGSLNVTAGITGSFSGNGSGLTGVGGYTVVSVSSTPYNAAQTSGDIILLVDAATAGATTINLPTAVSNTAKFTVKKIDSGTNSVTTTASGSQTIDGAASAQLLIPSASITLISNNSNWFII
jgi:hypothetical protein